MNAQIEGKIRAADCYLADYLVILFMQPYIVIIRCSSGFIEK